MIYCTGYDSFLLSNIRNFLKDSYDFIDVSKNHTLNTKHLLNMRNDTVLDFAFPIDDDFNSDAFECAKNTLKIVKICNLTNSTLIYASSYGVDYKLNFYDCMKDLVEEFIRINCNSYKIIRIPRVYDSSRKNGLMKTIRNNDINLYDIDKKIPYSTLDNFLIGFKKILEDLDTNKEYSIKENKTNTIKEIGKLFCLM